MEAPPQPRHHVWLSSLVPGPKVPPKIWPSHWTAKYCQKPLNAANTEPGADIDFTEFPFQLLINCSELRSFFIYSHHSNRFHFGLVISDAFAPDTNIQRSKVFICEKSKESNVPMSNEGIVSPFNQRFPAIIAPSLLPRAPEAVIK